MKTNQSFQMSKQFFIFNLKFLQINGQFFNIINALTMFSLLINSFLDITKTSLQILNGLAVAFLQKFKSLGISLTNFFVGFIQFATKFLQL